MNSEMAFECLLISHDPGVFGVISRILRDMAIEMNHCLSSSKALNLWESHSTDLIVIDWEGEASSDLLHEIWKEGNRNKQTIVAISSANDRMPGVHVVIKKPVTAESGAKSLKNAYSRMIMDHRRHARYALMASVNALREDNRTVPVTVADIGEGGVALITKEEITVGNVLSLRLLLPGAIREIVIQIRVLWVRDFGRAGCEFLRIPPVDLDILHDWLMNKIQIRKPLIAF